MAGLIMYYITKIFITITASYSQMGQEASQISQIHRKTQSLMLLKQDLGQKIYINHKTQEEYMVITRLVNETDSDVEQTLRKRKEIKSIYIPELLHYGKQTQNYCSNITTMHILFKQPSKSLAEEEVHRLEAHQWFQQGEILMISYCILNALQEYRKISDNYQVTINQNTILIQICGNIILSDNDRFKEKMIHRQSLRRISMERSRIQERASMTQLSIVLERLMDEKDQNKEYSAEINRFVKLLRNGQFNSYEMAILYLNHIKEKDVSSSKRRSKNATAVQETPKNSFSQGSMLTPIDQLIKLAQFRSPLSQIKNNGNSTAKKIQFIMTKKKQSKSKAFKTQFQAKKVQSFAEQADEVISSQQGISLPIDDMSSIHERHRMTEEDQAQPLPHFYDHYLIQESLSSIESQQLPSNKIQLFTSNQPLKLKQLVLNQKGIIYEQSADELQSMASQRTFRLKNIQHYNQ